MLERERSARRAQRDARFVAVAPRQQVFVRAAQPRVAGTCTAAASSRRPRREFKERLLTLRRVEAQAQQRRPRQNAAYVMRPSHRRDARPRLPPALRHVTHTPSVWLNVLALVVRAARHAKAHVGTQVRTKTAQ